MAGLREYVRRFWFEFDETHDVAAVLRRGCGVTAASRADAEELITVALGRPLPAVMSVVEDVDVRTLDQAHVVPNVGDVSVRGIWFPAGYAPPAN